MISEIAVSGAGDIYVIGDFTSGNFNPGAGKNLTIASANVLDVWVAKVDSNGNTIWAVSFGSTGSDRGNHIAVSKDDSAVYIVGSYSAAITFGTTTLTTNLGVEAFMAKLSTTDGSVIWATRLYGNGGEHAYGIAVDFTSPNEEVAVVGVTSATTPINVKNATYSYPLAGGTAGFIDGWLIRLNGADGLPLWGVTVGGGGHDYFSGVAIHQATGHIYVAGHFASSSVKFNGSSYTAGGVGALSPGVVSFNSDGTARWIKTFAASASDEVFSISVDQASENVYVSWYKDSSNTQTFGNTTLSSAGIVLVGFASTGSVLGVYQMTGFTGTSSDILATHVDADSNVWISGFGISNTAALLGAKWAGYGGTSDILQGLFTTSLTPLQYPVV